MQLRAIQPAVIGSVQATTDAVGSSRAISMARLGPETTATRSAGRSSSAQMTSLMRASVWSSRPFMRDTTTAPGARCSFQACSCGRRVCAGTARMTSSAPARTSETSLDAVMLDGSVMPFRYCSLRCRVLIWSTTSGRRPQRRMFRSTPEAVAASATTLAKVVPQEPAPRTATVVAESGFRGRSPSPMIRRHRFRWSCGAVRVNSGRAWAGCAPPGPSAARAAVLRAVPPGGR